MSEDPNLSIILPVHNEVDSLEKVISEWDTALRKIPDLRHTFLICEDGSTDGTPKLIRALEGHYPIINNSVTWRRGYGQAVRDGIALAKTDYILCIDSDGQIGPDQFDEFWHRRSKAHFSMGWRHPRVDPTIRLVYSRFFKFYHSILFPNSLHDPSCPFVLGHSELFKSLTPLLTYMKEGFWWGFTGACWKLGIPIIEVQIPHRARFAGDTQVYKLGKMPGIILRNGMGLLKLRFAHSRLTGHDAA